MSELYFRRFWWAFAPWSLLGLYLVFTSPNQTLRIVGYLIAVWPATIPLRAYYLTKSKSKIYQEPVRVILDPEWVLFDSKSAKWKVNRRRIVSVTPVQDCLALCVSFTKFAFVSKAAFETPEEAESFRREVSTRKSPLPSE